MRLSDAVAHLNVTRFVPDEYAAYRPLISDALRYFLDRLSAPRQAAILAEQVALPARTPLEARVTRLLSRCPTLHKLGQVLARDRRLAAGLRENLQALETCGPTVSLEEVSRIIRDEAGGDTALSIRTSGLAEASVAVVVPFTSHERVDGAPMDGVLKVLKPNVKEHLAEERAIWSSLGDFLEARAVHHGLPALPYRETFDQVIGRLAREVRLDAEQAHIVRARQVHAGDARVLVPRLFPMSTPGMTAMERVRGVKPTELARGSPRRARLASVAVEALLARPFWSSEPVAEFHGDPHAGNLMATDDGRLAVLDWSLVARLDGHQRAAVIHVVLGGLCLDEVRVRRAVDALATRIVDASAVRRVVGDAVRRVRRGRLPGFEWLAALFDRLVSAGAVVFDEDLTLFRKAMLNLSGVVGDLAPGRTIDRVLASTGATQFLGEIPARASIGNRHDTLGLHLSNAELADAWRGLFFAPARYWIGSWRDALSPTVNPPAAG